MDENLSGGNLVDIVRDLHEVESDPNSSPIYEERQGDENIRLNNENENTPEQW